jgi:hypothetical protein
MTRITKTTVTNKYAGLTVALVALTAGSMMAGDAVMSPRGRALAEDLRKVPVTSVDRVDRNVTPGSPRGRASEAKVAPGSSTDRLNRSAHVGSPRGRETFPGMGSTGR